MTYIRMYGACMVLALALGAAGCTLAYSPQKRMALAHLEHARYCYSQAKADPEIEEHAPAALRDAGQTLADASRVGDFYEINHLAYIAERQTDTAVSLAHTQQTLREGDDLQHENDRLIDQKSASARDSEVK